jgi:hypothetical protein
MKQTILAKEMMMAKKKLELLQFPADRIKEPKITNLISDLQAIIKKHNAILSDLYLISRPLEGDVESCLNIEINVSGLE